MGLKIAIAAILAVTISTSMAAATPETCMQTLLPAQINAQNKIYMTMGGLGVIPSQQSFFIPGTTGKVVVMFHGFLGTPEEMLPLANKMHAQNGDAIYAPLIFGFGDNDQVTNLSTLTQWQTSVQEAVALAVSCYAKIDVIGYSMGAGLLTDFLLHQPEIAASGSYHGSIINQTTLYSPYWLPHPLSLLLEPTVEAELQTRQSVPFKDLSQIMDPDMIQQLMPDFNDTDVIPLKGLLTVLQMKRLFLNGNPGTAVLPMPTLIVYAEDDPIMDPRFVPIFTAQHFSHAQYKIYPAGSGVRHQTLQRQTQGN